MHSVRPLRLWQAAALQAQLERAQQMLRDASTQLQGSQVHVARCTFCVLRICNLPIPVFPLPLVGRARFRLMRL